MKRHYFHLALTLGLQSLACQPTRAPQPPAALARNTPATPSQSMPHASAPKAPKSEKTDPKHSETGLPTLPNSLRLSWLPKDTMAVAQLRPSSTLPAQLSKAMRTPPASRLRSLPLAIKFSLQQLTLRALWPRPQRPLAALVWGPKQRAFWLWNQDDLSLDARRALEKELHASTRFAPPYWIFDSAPGQLEFFVHHRAGWLLACPKAWAPEVRAWLAKLSADQVGRLDWAPSAQDSASLLLRWRAPQLLESAPDPSVKALPVIGELRTDARGGIEVNGAPRGQP